jgi:hypothetical protein
VQHAAFNPILGAANAHLAMPQFLKQLWGNGYVGGLQGGVALALEKTWAKFLATLNKV